LRDLVLLVPPFVRPVVVMPVAGPPESLVPVPPTPETVEPSTGTFDGAIPVVENGTPVRPVECDRSHTPVSQGSVGARGGALFH
jgi:hypothetical protein